MKYQWCYNPVTVLILLSFLHIARSEIFTALVHMEKLLRAERTVANDIRAFVTKERQRLDKLTSIADDYENHSIEALQDTEKHLSNPVNAFLLMKRFTTDWYKVKELIEQNSTSQDITAQLEKTESESFPEIEDLNGAAAALLRLQDTYDIPTTKIAGGNLSKVALSPEMTAADCFELGKLSYNTGDHYHSILWMQETIDRLDSEKVPSVDKALTLDYLAYSTFQQGNVHHALKLTLEWLTLAPNHQRALSNKKYYEKMINEENEKNPRRRGDDGDLPAIKNERPTDSYKSSEEFINYEQLCRGVTTVKQKYLSKLKCYYAHNNHPLLLIQPMKAEDVHFKPWLVIYHDILSDEEIKNFKTTASPRLTRATIHNPDTGKIEHATYRVSKSAWLTSEENEITESVNHRVAALTGLNLETAEDLQVVNYGIGGHYEPHYDFARKEEKTAFRDELGNRIATMLFYMSDVETGGATVFVNLGLRIFPRKGTAVFWYNLLKSGEGDYTTRHAACPVLTGTKWVMNKWFHERGQEFKRPCGINENEYK